MKTCKICKAEFDETAPQTLYGEAGEWLAKEMWEDAGELCMTCLENRARLSMMYCHEMNR
jgi:hypothetical protein